MENMLNIQNYRSLEEMEKIIDTSYRYKMPGVQVKHEGRGNGVKTVLLNLDDIGKSLNRIPSDILQYLAAEFSVLSIIKTHYILNGTISSSDIQKNLQKFINSHVICDKCENPETTFLLEKISKKDYNLCKECAACGEKILIQNHKVNKKIITRLSHGQLSSSS